MYALLQYVIEMHLLWQVLSHFRSSVYDNASCFTTDNCVHYGKVHYPGAKIQANCNNW